MIDWMLFGATFATLFVITDPAGNIPVFVALTSAMPLRDKARAALQATLTSLGVIVGFAVFGRYVLDFLDISVPALELSGGVLLFLVSMELLTDKDGGMPNFGSSAVNVALVPLGTPLLAGPGSIVATMVAVERANNTLAGFLAVGTAILLIHLVLWVSMRFSTFLGKLFGEGGTLLLTKISGVLLAAIATQMVAVGVGHFVRLYQSGQLF